MAFNKTKVMEAALKALNQGKVAQAIQEYQSILRVDSRDQAVLMTVGDLFVRQGNMQQAVEYFERLADLYLHDGFNSKAIAIYKKISKLAPAETQPLEKLANLYVQQGILSEARPIFLQLAEAFLKASQTNKAVDVLRRLLEVEPDNPRVQRRLAELYLAIGQKKEAAITYLNFARYLTEHGDTAEGLKMVDAALGVEPENSAAVLLKARILGASGQSDAAMAVLAKHPDADSSSETQSLQVDLCLKAGKTDQAIALAKTPDSDGNLKFPLIFRVANALLEAGESDRALELIGGTREAALAAGEKERLITSLTGISERLAGRTEPLAWLVDIYRQSADTYHLSEAQSQLADALINAEKLGEAETLLKDILEHEPDNELARQRLNQLQKEMGRGSAAPASPGEHAPVTPTRDGAIEAPAPVAPSVSDLGLDEDTQRYISQALTDVDLLSSYGLTQKATQLLETILQRVPRHAPTLERLLDISLGAGNDRRTAELAAQLEQIYLQRGDTKNAERFAELRRRFQRSSGATEEELAAAQPAAPTAPAEFVVPVSSSDAPAEAQPVNASAAPVEHEIDLSDEWAQLSAESPEETVAEPAAAKEAAPAAEAPQAPSAEVPVAQGESESAEFDLELVSDSSESGNDAMTAEGFLDQLVAEVEGFDSAAEAPAAEKPPQKPAAAQPKPAEERVPAEKRRAETPPPPREVVPAREEPSPVAAVAGGTNGLSEVFQEFRAEFGEMGEEDEDLETHYNLGIAYREMGLLDEAIGEFQKVAKAVQAGRPFRYAMQCATFLGLTFMDKQEPKIASLWYERALETPGLDQESILALRYDLGVAEEQAGDADAALDSFRQVYAMNIDYRDVAEHIAALQKA